MSFSFTATAQCEMCGQLLGSSEEECSHDGEPVEEHVFRRLEQPDAEIVEACPSWSWYKLAESVGEDWIAYQYLGSPKSVESKIESSVFPGFAKLKPLALSPNAPSDVNETILSDE